MELNDLIGFPKDEVLKILDEKHIKYSIEIFNENKKYDTELLTFFREEKDGYILYFDKFLLNI